MPRRILIDNDGKKENLETATVTSDGGEVPGASGDYVEKTDSYTLVIADAGKLVAINKNTAANWTVPPNSAVPFPTNTEIAGAQLGDGEVTVVAGSGVTIRSAGDLVETADQYATFAVKKIGTNVWLLAGNLA